MSVTVHSPLQIDDHTWKVTWESDIANPLYRVYRDGLLINTTVTAHQVFFVASGDYLSVEIRDDNLPPEFYPSRFILAWYGVADADHYRVERFESGVWKQKILIRESGLGFYTYKSKLLEDVTDHSFRVVPVGIGGADGALLEITEYMVRNPDPPAQKFSYSNLTHEVTLNA